MSLTKTTSTQRLIAAKDMMEEGLTLEYCAGMFSLPVLELEGYIQAGLLVESSTDIPEINTSEPDWSKHTSHKPACYAQEGAPISRQCPYPNSGHLAVGGVQKHSAGDIYPYVIVAMGDLEQPDFYLIGNGLTIGDAVKFGLYKSAHKYATELLNPLLK